MIRIGSLFTGIGGLDLGVEAGLNSVGLVARTVWQVEIDNYCREILARHWPTVTRYSDVRTARSLPAADVVIGGFPCQDVSVAGAGRGITGERSGLWREYARVVDEVRPRAVVVENVPGLRTRGLATVVGTLADLGYDAAWDVLSAGECGAPHRRRRLWIVAWRRDLADTDGVELRLRAERGPGRSPDVVRAADAG